MKRYEDCGCQNMRANCRINPCEPPPKGYKCNCRYNVFFCSGYAVPCNDDPDSKACSGCANKECCSEEGWNGDCNWYIGRPDYVATC